MDHLDLKKRPRILLADDSVTIRKVIELTFADEGIDVTSVADGDQAMRSFVENQPDLVIADVNMPGITGYTLCEMIKLDETTRDVPVVLLTGSFEPFDAGEASRVGADYYFTKPFQSVRDVVEKVVDLLDNRSFDIAMENDTADIDDLYVESIYSANDDTVDVETVEFSATSEGAFEPVLADDLEEPAAAITETAAADDIHDPYADTIESLPEPEFERIVDDESGDSANVPPLIENVTLDADLDYLNRAADAAESSVENTGVFQRVFDDAGFDDELIEEFRPVVDRDETKPAATSLAVDDESATPKPIDPFATTAAETPVLADQAESTLIKFEIDETETAKPENAYSPELVDAIVDRLMERLSDKAVREAAQEAVPRIAEKLIREALDEKTQS